MEFKRGILPSAIFRQLCEVFGENNMFGLSTVQRWCSNFSQNLSACPGDASNAGRKPINGRSEEVLALIEADRGLSVRNIECMTNIPKSSVERILQTNGFRSILGIWVPKLLTDANKEARIESANLIKCALLDAGDHRYSHFIVEDETWIYHDITYRSVDRRVRLKDGEFRPQFPKQKLTPAKTMILVAMTADCKFSVEALSTNETLDAARYQQFINSTFHRWRNLRSKAFSLSDGGILFQHDNARPHTAESTRTHLLEKGITLIKQAPYSPDLNILDRWLNQKIKESLNHVVLSDHADVLNSVKQVLATIDENELKHQVDLLITHCDKVIANNGSYITD